MARQFILRAGKRDVPRCFVGHFCQQKLGERVLCLVRQSRRLLKNLFEQLRHAYILSRYASPNQPSLWNVASGGGLHYAGCQPVVAETAFSVPAH
jgi:hypothetical protein